MTISSMNTQIDDYDDKSTGKGASVAEIDDAEAKLSVKFPESYKVFLNLYGWARFASNEFYGLGADVPAHLGLVMNTSAERTEMQPTIPQSLVPVLNDGGGNHYCLDTQGMNDGECPVVFWDHDEGPNQQPSHEANSFDDWIVDFIREI